MFNRGSDSINGYDGCVYKELRLAYYPFRAIHDSGALSEIIPPFEYH